MSAVVLHHSELLSLASTSRVIAADDVGHLTSMVDKASALSSLLNDETQRVDEARAQARDAGYAEGFEAAQQAGLADAEQQLSARRDELDQRQSQLQNDATQMAFEIVRKLAASLDPADLLAGLAMSAANACEPDEQLVLRVHEKYRQSVADKLTSTTDGQARFAHVIGDASVSLSTCIIETASSRILADLETQTHLLETQLVNR